MAANFLIIPGRYSALDSRLHRLNTKIKILLFTSVIISIMIAKNWQQLVFIFAFFLVPALIYLKIPGSFIIRSLLSLIFLSALIVLFNYLAAGKGGIIPGIYLIVKLLYLIIISSIFTLCTLPLKFILTIEPFFKPLKIIDINPKEISFVILYSLKFMAITFDIILNTIAQMNQRKIKILGNIQSFFVSIMENSLKKSEHIADTLLIRGIDLNAPNIRLNEKIHTADLLLLAYTFIGIAIFLII